jgi:hypothetical protein
VAGQSSSNLICHPLFCEKKKVRLKFCPLYPPALRRRFAPEAIMSRLMRIEYHGAIHLMDKALV